MKWLKILVLGLMLTGCPKTPVSPATKADAETAAAYQVALTDCIVAAEWSIQNGVGKAKVQAAYDICAGAADKKYGKK